MASCAPITVEPHRGDSAQLEDVDDPDPRMGSVLCEAVAVGVCGTDIEITTGAYGWAPPGKTRLVLGHESLGRVVDPGPASGFAKGDLVVGIVRRPDAVPCPSCAVGEWDMCRNGQYTERGIKAVDGYMSERWRIEPEYAVRVGRELGTLGVLLEPTTVVAKAWEVVGAAGMRAFWEPTDARSSPARADRAPGRAARRATGARCARARSCRHRAQARARKALGATYHIGRGAGCRLRARHRDRGDGRAPGRRRRDRRARVRRGRVPHRHRQQRRPARGAHR